MKLPDKYNLYKHNSEIDKLLYSAALMAADYGDGCSIVEIIEQNETVLKKMMAIIMHLSLVNEEVLKLENKND